MLRRRLDSDRTTGPLLYSTNNQLLPRCALEVDLQQQKLRTAPLIWGVPVYPVSPERTSFRPVHTLPVQGPWAWATDVKAATAPVFGTNTA